MKKLFFLFFICLFVGLSVSFAEGDFQVIAKCPTQLFDSHTGKPLYYYAQLQNGKIELFSNPGYHPRYRIKLKLLNKQIASIFLAQQRLIAQQRSAEEQQKIKEQKIAEENLRNQQEQKEIEQKKALEAQQILNSKLQELEQQQKALQSQIDKQRQQNQILANQKQQLTKLKTRHAPKAKPTAQKKKLPQQLNKEKSEALLPAKFSNDEQSKISALRLAAEQEKIAAEKLEREKLSALRLAEKKDRIEAEKLAREKSEAQAAAQAEKEAAEAQQKEQERIKAEKLAKEKRALEKEKAAMEGDGWNVIDDGRSVIFEKPYNRK